MALQILCKYPVLINPKYHLWFHPKHIPRGRPNNRSRVLRLLVRKHHQNLQLRLVKKGPLQTDRNIAQSIHFSSKKPTNNTEICSCVVPTTGCMRITWSALYSFTYFCLRANHKALVIKNEKLLLPENGIFLWLYLNFLGGAIRLKRSQKLEAEKTCKVTLFPDCSHHVFPNSLSNTTTYCQVTKPCTKVRLQIKWAQFLQNPSSIY